MEIRKSAPDTSWIATETAYEGKPVWGFIFLAALVAILGSVGAVLLAIDEVKQPEVPVATPCTYGPPPTWYAR
jgi:hypothetical protein